MLPSVIKNKIAIYLRTPEAEIIQKEIERVQTIVNSNRLFPEQTIWSVMTIDWYDYYYTDAARYRQDNRMNCTQNLMVFNELKKAKEQHIIIDYDREMQKTVVESKKYGDLLRGRHSHVKLTYYMDENCENLFKKYIEYLCWIEYSNKYFA
jgi:hypothetical protein